jgi:O-antigen/teichoic acid export membrane protein
MMSAEVGQRQGEAAPSRGATVAKNLGAVLVAQLLTWALALVVSLLVPRYLGAAAIGEIAVAYATWSVAAVLIVFGMDLYLTQMVAREPARTGELVGTSLALRLLLFGLSCAGVAAYLAAAGHPASTVAITWIMGLSFLLNALASGLIAGLNGLERMAYVSLASVLSKLVYTVANLLCIALGLGVYAIAATHSLMALTAAVLAWAALRRFAPIRLRLNPAHARAMLVATSPLLLYNLVLAAYQQLGKLQLASLADTAAVGYFSVATTLFGTLMFVPVAVGTALLPAIARSYAGTAAGDVLLLRRSFNLVLLIGIPVGLGVAVAGEPIVLLALGPAFAPAGPVLLLLGLALVFTYLNTTLSPFLVSMGRTGAWTGVMLAGTLATLLLNQLLIPWFAARGNGAVGAGLAFLTTEALICLGAVLLLPRDSFGWENVRVLVRASCAGLLMFVAAWGWHDRSLLVAVLLGAIVYPGAVLLLGVLPRDELALIRAVGGELLQKVRRRLGLR